MAYEGAVYPGQLILISSQTANNSASITFTSGITTTYNNYYLLVSNYRPVTDPSNLQLQISTDGGSTYITTGYNGSTNNFIWNSATIANTNITTAFLLGALVQGGPQPMNSFINFYDLTSNTGYPMASGISVGVFNGNFGTSIVTGLYNIASTVVNAIKISAASGNILTGTFSLYGIKEN